MDTNEEVLKLLDMVKDTLASLASSVYEAQKDGKIDVMEGLALGMTATSSAMQIVGAFKGLSTAGVEALLDALENSDLVIQ